VNPYYSEKLSRIATLCFLQKYIKSELTHFFLSSSLVVRFTHCVEKWGIQGSNPSPCTNYP